jgi:hypothetical protein
VLASYAANSPAELSIQEGEEVVFLRNDPSGWTEVSNKAGEYFGIFLVVLVFVLCCV